jgi:stage II sporulation protein P
MNWNKQALRVGGLAILFAMLLRIIGSGVFGSTLAVFAQPELASFLIYSETGRKPSLSDQTGTSTAPSTAETTQPTLPPETTVPTQPSTPVILPVDKAVFTTEDAKYFQMNYSCSLRPNVKNLLTQALNWDLTGDEPTILIVHTHGTEAFTETADTQYDDYGGSYRTKDDRYNMISIGDELTRLLTQAGLSVIHDRTAHDLNDYLDAYDNSRAAVQKYLQQYPSIKMVLDLHRDAAQYADGTQWATSATVNGEDSAQLMFVVGTNARGLNHPNWQTNLSIAEKLNVLMEKNVSGLTRPIDLRSQRFNHDLAMGAMIVEVGAAGNTHPEAMNAISVLAEAIVELAHGSK